MPNEFEKLVQQKMDELKLVPSEPVWQKVEMQIRKKKDRKRLIFWILFLVLLLGGGLWIGIDQYSNQVSYNIPTAKNNNKNSDRKSQKATTTNTTTANDTDKESSESRRPIVNSNTLQSDKVKQESKAENPIGNLRKRDGNEDNSKYLSGTEDLPKEKKQVPTGIEESQLIRTKIPEVLIQLPTEKVNNVVSSFDIIRPADTAIAFQVIEEKMKPNISMPDSVKQDSVSAKKSIQQQDTAAVKKLDSKKLASSKWKCNLEFASGLSGSSRLNFFDGQKSMDALYYASPSGGTTGPGMIYAGPSSIKKGLSFSIGAAMQKKISKKLLFSVGLQYNYYSNAIWVGNKIVRDTVFRAYSVSQYFTNNRNIYSISIVPYHNQYHFISMPLTIDWQVLKKFPLNFHTGFSVQQMIQTNALIFDFNSQAYYHSSKAFNKTLVFTEYGLSYSVPLSKTYLAFGPQLQYGLGRLEKKNSDHHLFSYGLKAQLQLGNK